MSVYPQIAVIAGPDKGKWYPVHPGAGHMVGRHQDAAYKLSDMRASRFHCALTADGDTVTVADNGGSGGTLVNGVALTAAHRLRHGDSLQVGETVLKFLTGPVSEATTVRGLTAPAEYDPAATDELAELAGRTMSRYQIGEPLGKGSTGMVFRATDTEDGREVALKVMQPAYARNDDDMGRFVRAMKAMLPLKHPNLVEVLAAGRSGPYCWAAMELVDGESLTEVIRRIGIAGMLDWKYAYRVMAHVARGLEHAHAHGIVHRDVAPPNILVRAADKTVKLGDLMLAKALEGNLAQQITRPGELVGDVNYMSPERSAGGGAAPDARSDLFGLGATCYALLSGKPPFQGATLVETVTKLRTAEPLKPSTFQMGVPHTFEAVVLKLLNKLPDHRFQTAKELLAELAVIGRANSVQV